MADDAAKQLEKEQMNAARLAEVQAADRRRAEIARQAVNESLNRAPELYQNKPAELVQQTEYGGIESGRAAEEEDEEEIEEENAPPAAGQEAAQGGVTAKQPGILERLQAARAKGAQTGKQKQQQIIRESKTRTDEINQKIKSETKKLDAEKRMSCLNYILLCIPGLGWIAALLIKIFSTKVKAEAIKARAEIEVLKRKNRAEQMKMELALKRERQRTQQMMR